MEVGAAATSNLDMNVHKPRGFGLLLATGFVAAPNPLPDPFAIPRA